MNDENIVSEGYQLSPQQKRLWFSGKGSLESIKRSMCRIVIKGKLDVNKLIQAINQVTQKHESLRTMYSYISSSSLPMQVIQDENADIQVKDLTSLPFEKIDRLVEKEINDLLNSNSFSPMSVRAIKKSENIHYLILQISSLSVDLYTMKLFVKEISDYYNFRLVEFKREEDQTVQYADVTEWFYELQNDENASVGRDFCIY